VKKYESEAREALTDHIELKNKYAQQAAAQTAKIEAEKNLVKKEN
jgi:hypothetical protein